MAIKLNVNTELAKGTFELFRVDSGPVKEINTITDFIDSINRIHQSDILLLSIIFYDRKSNLKINEDCIDRLNVVLKIIRQNLIIPGNIIYAKNFIGELESDTFTDLDCCTLISILTHECLLDPNANIEWTLKDLLNNKDLKFIFNKYNDQIIDESEYINILRLVAAINTAVFYLDNDKYKRWVFGCYAYVTSSAVLNIKEIYQSLIGLINKCIDDNI